WPSGQYTPVRGTEHGTIGSMISAASQSRSTNAAPARQLALAMVPHGAAAKDHPVLLVTKQGGALRTVVTTAGGGVGHALPFALPSDVRPGETRALAVNTKDGATVYDVAYALVTVTDGAPVTNVNDAWALASCRACTTVAVSFQVVLVVGQSNVVTPVNAAVAANGSCVRCLTTAMAVQLVVTLTQAPSAADQRALQTAMSRLREVQGRGPAQLQAVVNDVQHQVLTILTDAGLVDRVTVTQATASATPSPSSTPPASSTTPEPSATASPTITSTPATTSPSAEPSGTPSASAEPSPTGS
ncbi:MAG: hypothetical protein JWO22_3635, partial [Frankiales bacterium]|nr:hypothetical protein [Frankiales bacterium]